MDGQMLGFLCQPNLPSLSHAKPKVMGRQASGDLRQPSLRSARAEVRSTPMLRGRLRRRTSTVR